MGTLFRSEKMQYVRLTIPREAAHDTVRELGYHGKYHFVDLMEHAGSQTDHFLYFKKRVVECSFWEKKMEKFEEEMKNNSIDIPAIDAAPLEIKQADLLVACKAMVDPLEAELNRNMEFLQNEKRTIHHLEEHVHVLTKLKGQLAMVVEDLPAHQEAPDVDDFGAPLEMTFMGSHKHGRDDLKKPLMSDTGAYALSSTSSRDVEDVKSSGQHFHNYMTGTIPAASQGLFERMLFRVSRGNAYVRYHSIEEDVYDPQSGEPMQKAVFHVVFVGRTLQTKVEKICDFFRANRYETPDYNEQFDQQVESINAMIAEKNIVLSQTEELIKKTLNRFAFDGAHSSPIRNWQDALRKERAICDALRMCQAPNNSQIVISEGWIPTEYVNEVRACLDTAVRHSQAQPAFLQELDTRKAPPTFFKTGKFTKVFQGIVDTYGVPRYQEVNPGVFTCVTFPFLFGIMYGDMGHAFFLTLAALLMIIYEDALTVKAKNKTLGEIPTMAFNGRYLLFGMGLCGFYAGSIYNDTFSVPINLFGTSWTYTSENVSTYAEWDGHVYPYGVDPLWYGTKNELTFFNSMKMKISVTFGVVQMTFGIVLSLFNHVYFGHGLSIFFEFLPQLLFMMSTFGYMIFLIIFKWTVDWPNLPSKNPPNLIQTMISMFLKPGSVEADKQLYTGQGMIQAVLVLVAVFSVPMMLFVKPCVENQRHKRKLAAQGRTSSKSGGGYAELHDQGNLNSSIVVVDEEHKEHVAAGGHDDEEEEEFDFSEAFIHQSIHTIEFVLGCVSNTASYLRLWALSLAHAELSSVFWNKLIMTYGVEMGFISFAGWGAWAGATFAVLMCMDVLECFLHALRLHWVEFQNKFFHADGYAFTPFNFEGKQDD